jgi:hypothetical protein
VPAVDRRMFEKAVEFEQKVRGFLKEGLSMW